MKVEKETGDRRMMLFTLWIFATLNYVYADVVTLFDKSVSTALSQTALLGAAVLVETAIAMTLPVPCIEVQSKSLGKHHRRCNKHCRCSRITASCNSGSLLPVLCNHRNSDYTDDYLVRVDMAQRRMMRPSAFLLQ
jgi:hypothetical protein